MRKRPIWIYPMAFAGLAALASACAPMQASRGAAAAPLAGWYVQEAARATLQPCGALQRLAVVNGAELRQRADGFGLQDGDPVYVRVLGSSTDSEFRLDRVEQFGSPTPVRDCPMTGTTIQR